jgi:hypothetical protein
MTAKKGLFQAGSSFRRNAGAIFVFNLSRDLKIGEERILKNGNAHCRRLSLEQRGRFYFLAESR